MYYSLHPISNFVKQKDKIEITLRKGIKTALGLPPNTPTVKLLRLGVSNTLDELIEAATVSQHQILLRSKTGRNIMERLGFEPSQCSKQTDIVPRPTRNRLMIIPLPKNMHPVFHEGRRKNRAMALQANLEGGLMCCIRTLPNTIPTRPHTQR